MTTSENYQMVMMLIDDSRSTYPSAAEVNRAINEAQMKKLKEYYLAQDERALRPLYRQSGFLDDNAVVIDAGNRYLLYPRSARLYRTSGQTEAQSQIMEFLEPDVYLNYIRTVHRNQPAQAFPRSAYYTIQKSYVAVDGIIKSYIRFSKGETGNRAKLWYVAYPKIYNHVFTGEAGTNQNLELPNEYHFEICALAAELINDMDVNELERGQIAYQNQRLTIEGVGK